MVSVEVEPSLSRASTKSGSAAARGRTVQVTCSHGSKDAALLIHLRFIPGQRLSWLYFGIQLRTLSSDELAVRSSLAYTPPTTQADFLAPLLDRDRSGIVGDC